jgi:hypothetical protein
MKPEELPTVGQWFLDNIGFLFIMIVFFAGLIFVIWNFLDKEKKSGFWTKFLTSLVAGFFITIIYFVYKVVMIGLGKL